MSWDRVPVHGLISKANNVFPMVIVQKKLGHETLTALSRVFIERNEQ